MNILPFEDVFYPLDKVITNSRGKVVKRTQTRYTIFVPAEGLAIAMTAVDDPMTLAWTGMDYRNANMALKYSFASVPGDYDTPFVQGDTVGHRADTIAVGKGTSVPLVDGAEYYLNLEFMPSAINPVVVDHNSYIVFTRILP